MPQRVHAPHGSCKLTQSQEGEKVLKCAAKDGPVPIACRKHAKGVNGKCVEGKCVCNKGFIGEKCDKTGCVNNCNDHGTCDTDDKVMVSANVPWDTMVKHAKRKIVQWMLWAWCLVKQLNVLARKVTL